MAIKAEKGQWQAMAVGRMPGGEGSVALLVASGRERHLIVEGMDSALGSDSSRKDRPGRRYNNTRLLRHSGHPTFRLLKYLVSKMRERWAFALAGSLACLYHGSGGPPMTLR